MANSTSKRREEVENNIRSCLVANKGTVTIQQLNFDYKHFEGENIPFREFNHETLHSFLNSLNHVLKIVNRDGQAIVEVIDSAKSAHVSSLVAGQRTAKGVGSRRSRHRHSSSGRHQRHHRESYYAGNSVSNSNNTRSGTYAAELENCYHESPQVTDNSNEDKNCMNDNDYVVNNDSAEMKNLLIKYRTKERLRDLIEKHSDGIWCAELPEKYLQAFCVPLDYSDLGFGSVREFASVLPKVFHCVSLNESGDYKLFDAQKPLPNFKKVEKRTEPTLNKQNNNVKEEPKAFPIKLDPRTCKNLIPKDVMDVTESVGIISVTQLCNDKDYEEVYVSEVYSPSFFWIQLRKRVQKFNRLMNEIHAFYEEEKTNYRIVPIMLEKGLNVACVYGKKWHRAIIKTVLKDGRALVLFYDYGTVKTYHSDDLCFLHRRFSYLPAQAIPCGLYNVKPFNSKEWEKSITWEFSHKTQTSLIATIGSKNVEENSLLICLTDTRGEDDFHINDWMYAQNYACQGRLLHSKNRNLNLLHYIECLKDKGYDPSFIHDPSTSELRIEYPLLNCDFNFSQSEYDSKTSIPNRENFSIIEKKKSEDARKLLRYREKMNAQNAKKVEKIPSLLHIKVSAPKEFLENQKLVKSRRLSENKIQNSSSNESQDNKQFNKASTSRDCNVLKPDKVTESKLIKNESEEHVSCPKILKRTLALLARRQEIQEDESISSPRSTVLETSCSSEYVDTTESIETSITKSTSSSESDLKIQLLKKMIKEKQRESLPPAENQNSYSTNYNKSKHTLPTQNPDVDKKLDLNSDSTFESFHKLKNVSTPIKKSELPLISDTSDSDSIPALSPLLLKKNVEAEKDISFFGSLRSECGGNGLMEPINWKEIRTILNKPECQPATVEPSPKPVKTPSNPPKQNVPLIKSEISCFISNDVNTTSCEKEVNFLPTGIVKPSVTSISRLLKLKQRFHANSFKCTQVLVSPKITQILQGKVQDISEDYDSFLMANRTDSDDSINTIVNKEMKETDEDMEEMEDAVKELEETTEELEAKNEIEEIYVKDEEENRKKEVEMQEKEEIDLSFKAGNLRNDQSDNLINSNSEENNLNIEKSVPRFWEDLRIKEMELDDNSNNKLTQISIKDQKPSTMRSRIQILPSNNNNNNSLDSDDYSSSGEEDESIDEDESTDKHELDNENVSAVNVINNQVSQSYSNPLVFNDMDVNSDNETWDGMSFVSNENLPLNFKSSKSVSSRMHSPERATMSVVNENIDRDLINFKYNDDMSRMKQKKKSKEVILPDEVEKKLTNSTSLKTNAFALNSTEILSSIKNFDPPGKSKSLKNMLLSMAQET